jgi:hypothetical protein
MYYNTVIKYYNTFISNVLKGDEGLREIPLDCDCYKNYCQHIFSTHDGQHHNNN